MYKLNRIKELIELLNKANKDKTTYRKYVVLLHPDKNPEDKLSTFRFVILDKLYKN